MRVLVVVVMLGVTVAAVGCTGGTPTSSAPTSTGVTSTGVTTGPRPPTASSTGCETAGWDAGDKEASPSSPAALIQVRAGQHECFDRVVFDINGSAEVGYHISYVPVVTADGSGEPVPVPGASALQVAVRAPARGYDPPGEPLARKGEYFYTEAQLAGWRSLRAVRYAGSFEGQTVIAVGVSAKLPFMVSDQLDDTGRLRKVVVDIAHRP